MDIFSQQTTRRDRKRRRGRIRSGIAVEMLEGRKLLSQIAMMPRLDDRVPADVSTREHRSGENNGGEVRKNPHYFEIFDNKGNRPDLNVVRASVQFNDDTNRLVFRGTMQGKINTIPTSAAQNSLYVFGVNRGSPKAIAPFALRQGVRFDAVVVVSINNTTGITAFVVDLTTPTPTRTVISADRIHIQGKEVRVDVDRGLLPTPAGGVPLQKYTFNLWPRESNGPDSTIASFIPENSMARISVEGHHHDR